MITLILAHPLEEHGQHVANALMKRGQKCLFFDTSTFPLRSRISLDSNGNGKLCLPDYPEIPFSEIRSVYWRNYNQIETGLPEVAPSSTVEYIANNDSRSLLESSLQSIDTLWVNGWDGYNKHQNKPSAFLAIKKLNAKVPKSIFSNDLDAIEEFLSEIPAAIQKPIQGGHHTKRINLKDFKSIRKSNASFAPATFQEEIKGTNIRAFVCGDQVLACEIRTQEIDFRDDRAPNFFIHPLPNDVISSSKAIAKELSLIWTGIDYRRTPDGEYYFLEANPSPMFIGFERYAGLPLTEAICDLLLSNNR